MEEQYRPLASPSEQVGHIRLDADLFEAELAREHFNSPAAMRNAARHTRAAGSRTARPRRSACPNASATASPAISRLPEARSTARHRRMPCSWYTASRAAVTSSRPARSFSTPDSRASSCTSNGQESEPPGSFTNPGTFLGISSWVGPGTVSRPRSLLAFVICAAVSCSLPATSFDAYRSKAADAAEEVASQARTAILTAHLAGQDRLLDTAVAVQLHDAEEGAAAAAASFASLEPPDRHADRLRARLLPVLQRISSAIARMRFDARRDDVAALLDLRSALIGPIERLERWARSNA